MRSIFIAAFIAAFLLPGPALAQVTCVPRKQLIKNLAENHQETPTALGLTTRGLVVEVLTSPSGTWTIIMTHPNGVACMMAVGQGWEDIARENAEKGPDT